MNPSRAETEKTTMAFRTCILAKPESIPENVMKRIEALEKAYPDIRPTVSGGLASLMREDVEDETPRPKPI